MKQKTSEIENFSRFEEELIKEVMKDSRNILESFKFSMIFNSKVTPEMQKQTQKNLKRYRNEHGLKNIEGYEEYVKGY